MIQYDAIIDKNIMTWKRRRRRDDGYIRMKGWNEAYLIYICNARVSNINVKLLRYLISFDYRIIQEKERDRMRECWFLPSFEIFIEFIINFFG